MNILARHTRKFLFLLLIVALTINCTNTETTAVNVEKESTPTVVVENQAEYVKQTVVNMWDAIEKGDMDRYASYIHPDFTQFGETAKVLRVGKEAEVKAIRDWVEEPTKVHTEMKDPRVTVRGETAWITYYWSDRGTTKGVPFATKGKSTRIFVLENGKWLCIHGHYTLLND